LRKFANSAAFLKIVFQEMTRPRAQDLADESSQSAAVVFAKQIAILKK